MITLLFDAVKLGNDVKRKWEELDAAGQESVKAEFAAFNDDFLIASKAAANAGTDVARGAFGSAKIFSRKLIESAAGRGLQADLTRAQATLAALERAERSYPTVPFAGSLAVHEVLRRSGDVPEDQVAASIPDHSADVVRQGMEFLLRVGLAERRGGWAGPKRIGLASTPITVQQQADVRGRLAEVGGEEIGLVARAVKLPAATMGSVVNALLAAEQVVWFGGLEVWLTREDLAHAIAEARDRVEVASNAVETRQEDDASRATAAPSSRTVETENDRELKAKADALRTSAIRLQAAINRAHRGEAPLPAPPKSLDPTLPRFPERPLLSSADAVSPPPTTAATPEPDPAPANDIGTTLTTLADLHAAGRLTKTQYEAAVDRALGLGAS